MKDTDQKLAIVTGGNRGLGFETCRQLGKLGYVVILTARHTVQGREQAEILKEEGLNVHFYHVDVNDPNSIGSLYEYVMSDFGRCDVLVNNAGILIEKADHVGEDLFEHLRHDKNSLNLTLDTNIVGPYLLSEAFGPIMRKKRYGRIVNVSSAMGQLSDMQEGFPAYRISKAGLNAVTCIFSSLYRGHNVLVNSISPGWVKTEMGGPNAPTAIEEGVDSIIWAATLPDGGPTGGFFQNRLPIPW